MDGAAARGAFDYPAGERAFVLVEETTSGGATIRDVTYESAGGRIVSAFLVVPNATEPSDRVAVVGHDFGGMYAALVAGLDARVDAAVILAGVPRFADWYLRYWNPVPAAEKPAYSATMAEVDPVTFLPDTDIPLFFQFAKSDQFVNGAAIDTWLAAAPADRTTAQTYAWNHSLHTETALADRRAFLATVLGLAE